MMKSQAIVERESDAIISLTTRRKCSSTLEKLRLAQGSLPSSPIFESTSSKRPRSSSRPRLVRSKSSSYLKPSTRRARKSCLPGNDHLSTADALWYLSLPQKVQRGCFTEDEQLILAGHCHSSVFSPPPSTFPRRLSNQSVPSLRSSTASTLSSESESESSEPSLYFDAIQEPADLVIDMDDSMMDELRWMDDQDIDLRLDDYHIHVIQASSPRKSWSSHRRPSFRRDLTSSIPPSSSGTATASHIQPSSRLVTPIEDSFPASYPSSPMADHRRRETPNFLPIHQNRASTDSSTTRHYLDLEARTQVRLWLASPSNFDEAVEFGFLPLEDSKEPSISIQDRPALSTHRFKTAPASPQTFFDDSSPSVFNAFDCPEDDEDSTSLPDLDMPGTPSDAAFADTHRLPTISSSTTTSKSPFSKPPSLDCPSELQTSLKPKLRYLAPEAGERHMTLRMTLTRPDLRDKEDVGTWGLKRDPLALEDLPTGRNGRTLWDEPPKQGGIVRKFWRKVSGKDV